LRVSLNASYKRHHSRTLKRDQRSSLRRKVHARPYPLLRGLLKVSSTFAQWHSSEKRANRRRPRRVLQHGSRFLKENQNRPRWAYAWDRTQRRIVVALCTGAKRHRKRQEGKGRNVRIDARRRKRKECTYGGLVRDPLSDLGAFPRRIRRWILKALSAAVSNHWEIIYVCNIFTTTNETGKRGSLEGKVKDGKRKRMFGQKKMLGLAFLGFENRHELCFE